MARICRRIGAIKNARLPQGPNDAERVSISAQQRVLILELLAQGTSPRDVAMRLGISMRQVAAVRAHVTMGTYDQRRDPPKSPASNGPASADVELPPTLAPERDEALPVGVDSVSGDVAYWNPWPSGSTNPHLLIIGESGSGKTYAAQCLIAELSTRGIPSVVFDYGQGFTSQTLPQEFRAATRPSEIAVGQLGVALNPLHIFPSDLHGPLNVAQRIADTFGRIYPKIGVQQHAVLREAVLALFAQAGITRERKDTWTLTPPDFNKIGDVLLEYSREPDNPKARIAATIESHISTTFVFRTFRTNGEHLKWGEVLASVGKTHILQLQSLEPSLEKVVTELLLWNFIGYCESLGPAPLRCFVVLDEAHKMSFDNGSPVERLLREGRKYGLGLILASQQPEDFSRIAFTNTATKLVFKINHSSDIVNRQIQQGRERSLLPLNLSTERLNSGSAYFLTKHRGHNIRVLPFSRRNLISPTS